MSAVLPLRIRLDSDTTPPRHCSTHATGLAVRKSEFRDPETGAGGPRREQILQAFFVNGDHAVGVAAGARHHLLAGHDQVELAPGPETDGDVLRIGRIDA